MRSTLMSTTASPPAAPAAPARRLRRPEAAAYAGVSPGFLEKAAIRGDGPQFIRLSARLIVYDTGDLDAWLTSRRTVSTSAPIAAE